MKELERTGIKDERIINLTDKDYEIMLLAQKEKEKRLTETPDKVNNSDLDKWDNTATKRYTIFK